MRKVIAIFLLLEIFTGQVGYYFFYAYQQYQVREAMKYQLLTGIPETSLEIIVAEEHESFRWEEKGKEFYQQGQMYDVAKSVIKDHKIILYCINDKKEEELIQQLGKAEKPGDSKAPKQHFKVQVIDSPVEPEVFPHSISLVSSPPYFCFDSAIIAFTKNVNAPPPRG